MSGRGTPKLGQTEVYRGDSDIISTGGYLTRHAPVPLQGRAGDDDGRRHILVSKRKVQALNDKVKR